MTTEIQAPEGGELPEPAFTLRWDDHGGQYKVCKPGINYAECYTADQMRAYARAALAAQPGVAACISANPRAGRPDAYCQDVRCGLVGQCNRQEPAPADGDCRPCGGMGIGPAGDPCKGCGGLGQRQARVALTDEQVMQLFIELNVACVTAEGPSEMFAVIVRAIERAHGIPAPQTKEQP